MSIPPRVRVGWREAMAAALYGPRGFFTAGPGPAAHFRTSSHTSTLFGAALLRLIEQVDTALGHPDPFDVVDVGAGRGELLRTLDTLEPDTLTRRLRLVAVERADRPTDLPARVHWYPTVPQRVTGLLIGSEWLDNVPLDVAEHHADDSDGRWRRVLVESETGRESLGGEPDPDEARWLARWWPSRPGGRAEIGLTRDAAWAQAVTAVRRGLAVAVDYGHLRADRPPLGTLTGFRSGRQVPPVPDGSRDLTAHVAVDAVAAAGAAVAGLPYALVSQRTALRQLGVDGRRPPLALAGTDPSGYLRALAAASAAAELTDPAGLGGHWWLLQPVGTETDSVVARWRS
jgi:SAM-dependent MidA family methyltransferase